MAEGVVDGIRYQYRWAVPGMPLTPAWLDQRDKGRLFSALRGAGLIALLEVARDRRIDEHRGHGFCDARLGCITEDD